MASSGWRTPPNLFSQIVTADVGDETKRTAREILQAVVLGSPVDKGAFRGNHRVSEMTPDYQFDEKRQDKSGNETLSVGLAAISESRPFTVLYIQNNLPYSVKLEQGHSGQAPKGVYSVAFETVLRNRR
ncbi:MULTISPECIES: hypothetical protein [unclassified Providencia]|uniref:hypothetical protein n=1 Tax=unclassified Providencia TaxID=2633465 RepID=UPI00234A72CC|nr:MULTISPECIES: hypothetical protein [unclassified Providencia]